MQIDYAAQHEKFIESQARLKLFVNENFLSLQEEATEYKLIQKIPLPGSKLLEGIELIKEIEPIYGLADVLAMIAEVKLDRLLDSNS